MKKQTLNLSTSEKIILSACALTITTMFVVLQTYYFAFSWLFLAILIIDIIVLIGLRPTEVAKRALLLASIFSALFAIIYMISIRMPWIFNS